MKTTTKIKLFFIAIYFISAFVCFGGKSLPPDSCNRTPCYSFGSLDNFQIWNELKGVKLAIQSLTFSSGGACCTNTVPVYEIAFGNGVNTYTSSPKFYRDTTLGTLVLGNRYSDFVGMPYSFDSNPLLVGARTIPADFGENAHFVVDATVNSCTVSLHGYNSYRRNIIVNGGGTINHTSFIEDAMVVNNNSAIGIDYGNYSRATISSGSAIGTRYRNYIIDHAGTGTVTTDYGMYIDLTKATNPNALRIVNGLTRISDVVSIEDAQLDLVGGGSVGDFSSPINLIHAATITSKILNKFNTHSSSVIFDVSNTSLLANHRILELAGTKFGTTTGTAGTGLATLKADLYFINTSQGIIYKTGSNARAGLATLTAGEATISNTSITANTVIKLTIQSLGTVTVPMPIGVTDKTEATSFTITSSDATDTSIIYWELVELD